MNKYPNSRKYRLPGEPSFFVRTGEFRAPLKGEFYLSGAIPEAYQAPNDLSTPYAILTPCEEPPRVIVIDGFTYRREGF
jgi:hypothetical protein